MRWLHLAEVLELHRRLIQRSGGMGGLRDLGLLEASLAQPHQSFGGADLYPGLSVKAAALGVFLDPEPSLRGREQAHRQCRDGDHPRPQWRGAHGRSRCRGGRCPCGRQWSVGSRRFHSLGEAEPAPPRRPVSGSIPRPLPGVQHLLRHKNSPGRSRSWWPWPRASEGQLALGERAHQRRIEELPIDQEISAEPLQPPQRSRTVGGGLLAQQLQGAGAEGPEGADAGCGSHCRRSGDPSAGRGGVKGQPPPRCGAQRSQRTRPADLRSP